MQRETSYQLFKAHLSTAAYALIFVLQSLHAAATASGYAYWQDILAIACCPVDAGQTDVMTDRPMAEFKDTERPGLNKNERKIVL